MIGWHVCVTLHRLCRSNIDVHRESYLREVHALKLIPPHPNVVEYYRAWQEEGIVTVPPLHTSMDLRMLIKIIGHLIIQTGLCECSLSDLLDSISGGDNQMFDTGNACASK